MNDVITLLKNLVSIDSINSGLIPGAAGEGQMATFTTDWFEDRKFDVQRYEANPGRPSIVATFKGTGGGRSLMFNGHMDTVGVEDYIGNPFDPVIEAGRLYGRGSADMKSGLAAMMIAAERAAARDLRGDILVALVADEEHTSIGTREILANGVTADAAIVPEPMGYELIVSHKGFIWLDVEVRGRSAHGSRPDLGLDAITKAGKFLVELEAYAVELATRVPHPLVGNPSVHASMIHGGQEVTSYPALCRISLERRTVPGETEVSVYAELDSILRRISEGDPEFKATLNTRHVGHTFEVEPDANIVSTLSQIAQRMTGRLPDLGAMSGWADCALLTEAGIPSLIFGPTGKGHHSATESVDLSSVEILADILTQTAIEFCA